MELSAIYIVLEACDFLYGVRSYFIFCMELEAIIHLLYGVRSYHSSSNTYWLYYCCLLLLLHYTIFLLHPISHSAASSNASGGGTTFSDKQALLDGLSRRAAISVKEKEGDEASSWMMSHVELNEALSGITMEAANWEVIKNGKCEMRGTEIYNVAL